MISLIICSRQPDISQSLKENIAKTIGIEYELIIIDNSKNNYSIFQAYNEGVRQAQYPYLCFMHDDVLYHTPHWGKKVVEHFQDEKVGLIGVVGTHFLPDTPCGWYHSMMVSGGCIQREVFDDKNSASEKRNLDRLKSQNSIDAVAVDGMWFCVRKVDFKQIQFDDINFTGFHSYDLDICMQIREHGLTVKIISDVLIEHFSYGSFDDEWLKSIQEFYNKWRKKLPQIAGVELSDTEIEIRTEFVKQVLVWITAYAQSQKELRTIRNSKSYKIGKTLLKPFSIFRKK